MGLLGRRYNRKKVPRLERISSWILVLLIVGIGVAVNVKGRHYDPTRYSPADGTTARNPAPGEAAANRSVPVSAGPLGTAMPTPAVTPADPPDATAGATPAVADGAAVTPAPAAAARREPPFAADGLKP
ncbi:MAG: hypothetical protein M1457_09460, partial [bacterium]|nr:hypothetical protein [bacterium]